VITDPTHGSSNYEFTSNVPGDGRVDADRAPGDGLELMFGRIDMANLSTGFLTSGDSKQNEINLLRNYFTRNFNYRMVVDPDLRPERAAVRSGGGVDFSGIVDYVVNDASTDPEDNAWQQKFDKPCSWKPNACGQSRRASRRSAGISAKRLWSSSIPHGISRIQAKGMATRPPTGRLS
jgi:hypothetical protein